MPGSVLDLAPVVPVVVVEDAARRRTARAGAGRRRAARDRGDAADTRPPSTRSGRSRRRCRTRWSAAARCSPRGRSRESVAAGARFLVSPGWTDGLLRRDGASGVPFLPGVSTDLRGGGAAGARGAGDEVLPGRGGGRHGVSEVAGRAVAAGAVLPDRRDRSAGTRRSISPCPTSAAWAALGCCRRTRSRRGTGSGSRRWRGPRRDSGTVQGRRWDVSLKSRTLALPSA